MDIGVNVNSADFNALHFCLRRSRKEICLVLSASCGEIRFIDAGIDVGLTYHGYTPDREHSEIHPNSYIPVINLRYPKNTYPVFLDTC
jgi:hypothetical protein